jgi:hypothetical protein
MLGFEGGLEVIDTFDQHDGLSRLRTPHQEFIQALARTKHHMQADLAAATGRF